MIQLNQDAVLAAFSHELCFVRRTGMRLWTISFPQKQQILAISFTNSKNTALVSTVTDTYSVSLIDGSVNQTFSNTPHVKIKRTNRHVSLFHGDLIASCRFIVCGLPDGQILLRDPRFGHAISSPIRAHSAAIVDIDVSDSLIATSGCSLNGSSFLPDQFICLFDAASPSRPNLLHRVEMPMNGPPHHLRFHPASSTSLLVASQMCELAWIDTRSSDASYAEVQTVPTSDYISAMDICATGAVVVVSDGMGVMYQLAVPPYNEGDPLEYNSYVMYPYSVY